MAAQDDGSSIARNPLLAHVAVAALDAILHPLPPRGFSSIAIPLRSAPSSLYLNALASTAAPDDGAAAELDEPLPSQQQQQQPPPSRATSSSSLRRRFQLAAPPEPKAAYTVLCVDASRVQRTAVSKVCQKWGQPCEVVSSGQEAVNLYKLDPEKYRCILMDTDLRGPIDSLAAVQQIRAFEEAASKRALGDSTEDAKPADPKAHDHQDEDHKTKDREAEDQAEAAEPVGAPRRTVSDPPGSSVPMAPSATGRVRSASGPARDPSATAPAGRPATKPFRRAVIIAVEPVLPTDPGVQRRYGDLGFDLVFQKPIHMHMMVNLLFGGPATNVVSQYGGVDDEALVKAGYPLQLRPKLPLRDRDARDIVAGLI